MSRLTGLALSLSLLVSACASTAPLYEARVSPDYVSLGNAHGIRAFLYGSKTVLEVPSGALWLAVYDEAGETAPFERLGSYYRLSHRLVRFTVRADMRSVGFRLVSAAQAAMPPPSQSHLSEVGQPREPKAAPVHLKAEDQHSPSLTRQSFRLTFARMSTTATLTPELDVELRELARGTQLVELHGYTDSLVAGPLDAAIAAGRAKSVRDLFVSRGVASERIKVAWSSAGEFAEPERTAAARAANRRVEVRLLERDASSQV